MKNKMLFAFASLCLCLVVQPSRAQTIQYTLQVPDSLKPPSSQLYAFKLKAVGVQKYQCEGDKWVHKGPSAELFNDKGVRVGSHGGGPSWKADLSGDTSLVTGKARVVIPSTSAGAIDWILLDASGQGNGMFGKITFIQRLETNGGKAPKGGCGEGCTGQVIEVPYTATYYFYKKY